MFDTLLEKFHPVVRSWFTESFGSPSPPQRLGWPSISDGKHTLIVAPTGSGKTLAAFLWCINHLVVENISRPPHSEFEPDIIPRKTRKKKTAHTSTGVRVLYISPLKALNNDIHRNLELPLSGIMTHAQQLGIPMEEIRSAVRTGDTTQSERTRMLKQPPDILITTPESLFLMLSSEKARTIFHSVRYVIVDEIHSISNSKRGVHLSVSLERLERLVADEREKSISSTGEPSPQTGPSFVRIGLSATQRPLEPVAQFLAGMEWRDDTLHPRPVSIIDAGYKKNVDLKVICPARDFADMPLDSVWSFIFPQLIQMIREHRTTLIFVNNRRLAERISARLNELLAGEESTTNNYAVPVLLPARHHTGTVSVSTSVPMNVFAYHGSMSRTVREQLESDLKLGKLRVLITTSALELGIDIGTVDLVIQIQSPKGIARGLQRVGRSGHLVDAQSKGRLFVTHREDLIESTVVAQGMMEHAIERTVIPENCLDVAAQQIVAMVGLEEWTTDDLFDLLRQSYCYRSLSEHVFRSILEMLAGRYSTDAFRELRARIVWNKLHQRLSPLPGASLLAITNAGTIPDRGYFGVYLEDLKTKIGEVDEEFIYESRAGDTFILGTNVWRIMEIDANKVVVVPAPGQPARMPFWRGEGIGRSYELGVRIGEFLEQLSSHSEEQQTELLHRYPIDRYAGRNIIEYLADQKLSTGIVPSHTTIVVEGFRDEVGDPRIVVHSCYGKGVNGLLGIVLTNVLTERLDTEVQMLYNNDGVLFRCSDVERLPLDLFSDVTVHSAEQHVLADLPASPLFGALFRQNAARALLLPKGRPGKRTPFFLQRLKSADLLQVVRRYTDFPIVVETIRECLTDVLDFEHFKEIIARIERNEIRIHTVNNESPSPFATTLLFDFAAVYMYEWDDPKQGGKQQYAQINRDLIAEVVNLETVRSVVRMDAVEKVEDHLQSTASTRRARSPEEVMELMLRLGEMTDDELSLRVVNTDFIAALKEQQILSSITIGSMAFTILTEEIPLYRPIATVSSDVLDRLPDEFRTAEIRKSEALKYCMMRMLRSRGPVTAAEIAGHFSVPEDDCAVLLETLSDTEQLIRGFFTDGSSTEQWCYRPNLERIHRASISLLRKEIMPASLSDFTRFLLQWQHRHPSSPVGHNDGVPSILHAFQGFALPSELWEPEIFGTRIKQYDGKLLRTLTQRGEYFCIGISSGKSMWIERGAGRFFLQNIDEQNDGLSKQSVSILEYLKENGASFLSDIREHTSYSLAAINRALSELFWSGLITNDVADEVLNVRRYRTSDSPLPAERFEIVNPRRNPLKSVAMKRVRTALKETPGWNGRWSRVRTKSILGAAVSDEEKISRQAAQLLLRYGIVAREIAKREEHLLSWPLLAMEFQRMEMRGEIRRGYFVEGLSGMQFALPDAVRLLDETKAHRPKNEPPIVLNALDPAHPYGPGIDPGATVSSAFPRFSRLPGNYIILHAGVPIAWIENFGTRIYFSESNDTVIEGLKQFTDHIRNSYPDKREIVVEYCNNSRPSESDAAAMLRSLGFYRDKVQTMRIDLH